MKRIFNWEQWPFGVIYIPFFFVWVYYWIRSRHFWFFSNVNPTLYFSGFEGETKKEMFGQIPAHLYPATIYIQPAENPGCIAEKMQRANLHFPVIAKPDIGTKGILVRKIETAEQLSAYHKLMAANYLIQEKINWPLELSIFYVRYPNAGKGMVTGLIAKEYAFVTGDGNSTLKQLINLHPKAFMIAEENLQLHKENSDAVVAAGEVVILSELGNHNRGARFIDLSHEIDGQLCCTMDRINLYSRHFYYGRYDVKTTSLSDLKQGKNISILEFNGVGSEPNHIYDNGLGYISAVKIIARHWRYMFEIGKINCKKGIAYIPFFKGISMLKASDKNTKLLQQLNLQCKI